MLSGLEDLLPILIGLITGIGLVWLLEDRNIGRDERADLPFDDEVRVTV